MSDIPADIMQAAADAIYDGPQYMLPDEGVNEEALILGVAKAILAERQKTAWQPIETAPKDGTKFWAAEEEDGWIIGACAWVKTSHVPLYGFHFLGGDPEEMSIDNPMFWMPLPAPPEAPTARSKALEELSSIDRDLVMIDGVGGQ